MYKQLFDCVGCWLAGSVSNINIKIKLNFLKAVEVYLYFMCLLEPLRDKPGCCDSGPI